MNAPSAVKFGASTYSINVGVAASIVVPLELVYGAKTCTAEPALPAGLTLENQTCAVMGTPTALSAATNYAITAQNKFGSSTGALTLEVIGIFYSVTNYNFTAGVGITAVNPAVGGVITSCAINPPLPAILNFNTTTCAITGMPSAPQLAATYTITATNAAGDSKAAISIAVAATVTQPSMSVPPGNYASAQSVSLYSGTPGASLYYTTDGSTPTTASTLYTTAIPVAANTTLKSLATKPGYTDSSVSAATYTIGGTATYALGGWVSGLQAGNLVLNNGSDTLTITGNGPFAFATPLAAAAAFTATIQSQTTTQTCRINIDNTASETGAGTMPAANFLNVAVVCDGDLLPTATYVYTGPTNHATYSGNYTTTDLATGRVWKSCVEGVTGATCFPALPSLPTWIPAGLACRALNDANTGAGYAGRKDWRLPTLAELQSLVKGTSIDGTAFPTSPVNAQWSATRWGTPAQTRVWAVDFTTGTTASSPKSATIATRCVAGP